MQRYSTSTRTRAQVRLLCGSTSGQGMSGGQAVISGRRTCGNQIPWAEAGTGLVVGDAERMCCSNLRLRP